MNDTPTTAHASAPGRSRAIQQALDDAVRARGNACCDIAADAGESAAQSDVRGRSSSPQGAEVCFEAMARDHDSRPDDDPALRSNTVTEARCQSEIRAPRHGDAAPLTETAAAPIRRAPDWAPLEAGSTLKHYEIIRRLGKGGMGAVFLARDTKLGRLVARAAATDQP